MLLYAEVKTLCLGSWTTLRLLVGSDGYALIFLSPCWMWSPSTHAWTPYRWLPVICLPFSFCCSAINQIIFSLICFQELLQNEELFFGLKNGNNTTFHMSEFERYCSSMFVSSFHPFVWGSFAYDWMFIMSVLHHMHKQFTKVMISHWQCYWVTVPLHIKKLFLGYCIKNLLL